MDGVYWVPSWVYYYVYLHLANIFIQLFCTAYFTFTSRPILTLLLSVSCPYVLIGLGRMLLHNKEVLFDNYWKSKTVASLTSNGQVLIRDIPKFTIQHVKIPVRVFLNTFSEDWPEYKVEI